MTAKHQENPSADHSIGSNLGRRFGGRKLRGIYIAVAVTFIGTYFIVNSLAATSTATLTLSPSSSTVGLGSTFTVAIHENSSTDTVNAVQANLTYPSSSLQFVSIDYSTSGFSTQAQSTTGSGSISIARGATTAVTGDQIVGVITFKTIALGASSVSFGCAYNASTCPSGNAVIRSTDNLNILTSQTNGTYTVNDLVVPSIPATPTVSSHTVTSVGISWAASTDNVGVTGYKIYRNGSQISTTATTSFTNTGLTPSTSYTYTVAAYDAAGNTSAQSTGVTAVTDADTTAPSVPGAPTQSSRTMTSQTISWTASTDNVGVTGYKVYRNGAQLTTLAATSYTDNSLTPGTSYTYTVAAYDAAGNTSAQSAGAALATAPDTTAPTAPTGLQSTAHTTNSVSLSWTASTDNVGVTGYKVYRNGSTTALTTVAGTSYNDTGLTGGTAYSYQVSAIDAAGNVSVKTTALPVTTSANGDINGDGHVNVFDLSIFLNHWNQTGTGLAEDLNSDNVVNVFDLSIMLNNYGT